MANNIVIESDEDKGDFKINDPTSALVSWILDHTNSWEEFRNINYEDKWEEYTRLWRGQHSPADKTRGSERSKLISPALSQAIEVAVAEQEEAVFGRGRWFDIKDDVMDKDNEDVMSFRNLLTEDLDESNIRAALSEIFLNGALYGTGIGKLVVEESEVMVLSQGSFGPEATSETKITVRLLPISPMEFVIDPLARSIKEALGMAHIMMVPKHTVVTKQRDGVYLSGKLGSHSDDTRIFSDAESKYNKDDDKTRIVEYHGLVPQSLFEMAILPLDEEFEELAELDIDKDIDVEDDILIEAIVTIANDHKLLKVVENPFLMKDRCFMAYQHDTIPNRFWGRGVAEKGYNPQKALDAELRGRIDAMALAIHPMVAVDATRIPRGESFAVRPGRTVLTQGDPRTVLMPFNFGQVGSATFPQTGELERMIQMGTGSMDSASGIGSNPRNATASGMSMMASGAIKRSKRTMANIEKNLIEPLVHKAAWRYMQFDPERYPQQDMKFIAYSTLGIMARELEQNNIANLLKTVPAESPAYWLLLGSFYENSAIFEKEDMLEIIDQMKEKSLNPQPDPMQQQMQQLQMQELMLNNKKTESEIMLNMAEAQQTGQSGGGQSEANKVELDAKLKVALQQMGDDTKTNIAVIGARTDVRMKEMDIAAHHDEVITTMKHDTLDTVKTMTDGELKGIKESISQISTDMDERDKERKDVNTKVANFLEKRGGEVAKLAKEITRK